MVLLSLAFLGCYIKHFHFYLSRWTSWTYLVPGWLLTLAYWLWFKFFPTSTKATSIPTQTSDPNHFQTTKEKNKSARKLLKLMLCAGAALPCIDSPHDAYINAQGMPHPSKIITSTRTLSVYNLQQLHTKLTTSTLFSVFNGLMNSNITPVLLDCGASACTSPDLESFEKGTLTKLAKPITLEGVGGGVTIEQQGIIKYNTIDDSGAPLTLRVPGYYSPGVKQHLLSPQVLFMTKKHQEH